MTSISVYDLLKLESQQPSHITLVIPRILKDGNCDYTYYQSVCSCGWSGDYKASKLTAQEDKCPNR